MSDKKITLRVPEAYLPLLEDLRKLKSDQQNPNFMSLKQQEQVWASLHKYGWAYPILTNKDGVLVDGEQRQSICLSHGEFFAPVLRLPVSDVDRRMLRQILNKLKGKHNKELDAAEYIRIVEAGEKEPLKALLASMGERLPEIVEEHDLPSTIPATYEIIVECKDEQYQKQTFEKLKAEGYKLRILTL
ncbi:MAG: ParB/RepB/Spo0J family partition protein [Candidatus Bathyarchaeota archaeon]|nr:ParB/RepB/Spo0J family partition protein [Candidatus Bathyarchaeota archaeon]